MSSFGGEVKPEVPGHDFAACKSSFASMNKNILQGQIHHFLRPFLLLAIR
jgi:hypothetical protein